MNILETILLVVVLISVIMTAVAEPRLSFEYGKVVLTSGMKLFGLAKNVWNAATTEETTMHPLNQTNSTGGS